MAERRSLGAAMEISPEKKAFIEGGMTTKRPTAPPSALSKTVEVEVRSDPKSIKPSVPPSAVETVPETKTKPLVRRPSRRGAASPSQPDASDVLDQVLVPVTIRLPHRTAQALKRASLEQRLKHAKPDTQQEIAEQALGDWLSKWGFLDE